MNKIEDLQNMCESKGEFIRITCSLEFEPHGRASETFEIIWNLFLPQIKYHWPSTKGWKIGTTDKPMGFGGKTLDNVVQQAILFLKEKPAE